VTARRWTLRPSLRPRTVERGQGLVEFAITLPIFMLLLIGMLEFGIMFDHHLSLSYASREGARTASALSNGGGPLGCGGSGSPNWASVDPQIVAAVERVLTSPGSLVTLPNIQQIKIYKANSSGGQVGGNVNVWTYDPGNGPTVDGKSLDFSQQSVGWQACARNNTWDCTVNPCSPPDSIGVAVTYRYDFQTGLGAILRFFGGTTFSSVQMSDDTVMALNPTD